MNDISLYEKISLEKNDFPIRILRQNVRPDKLVPHWHEHIEMLFLTHGSCNMTCGQNTFTAKKGDLVFVNDNELHFFDKADKLEYLGLIINPEIFKSLDNNNFVVENLIQSDRHIEKIFSSISEESTKKSTGYKISIMGYVYELITYLIRNYPKEQSLSTPSYENEITTNRKTEILSYILSHYADKLTTAELAKKWYLSEYYFCKFFKSTTGQSPMNYINRTRIEKSATLLKNTDESITNIAIKVGFNDVNYYSRTFKKFMNMSPTQYRKMK